MYLGVSRNLFFKIIIILYPFDLWPYYCIIKMQISLIAYCAHMCQRWSLLCTFCVYSFSRTNDPAIQKTPDADVFQFLAGEIVKHNKKMKEFDNVSCYYKSNNRGVENGAQWLQRYKVRNCLRQNRIGNWIAIKLTFRKRINVGLWEILDMHSPTLQS